MRRASLLALLAVALLALALAMAACGGDGDDDAPAMPDATRPVATGDADAAPTARDQAALEAYFSNVETLTLTFNEAAIALEEPLNAASTSQDAAAAKEGLQQFLRGLKDALDAYVSGMDALDAPHEAEEAHEDVVQSGGDASGKLGELLNAADEAETVSDVQAIIGGLNPRPPELQRFGDSCEPLQAVADRYAISADLLCSN